MATTRETFFAAIREAARSRPAEVKDHPALDESIIRLTSRTADLAKKLAESITASGAVAHLLAGPEELPAAVAEVCRKHNVRTAIAEGDGAIDPLIRAAEQAGVAVTRWSAQDNVEAAFQADAGLTGVAYAVAETGSLVMASRPAAGRLLSLAPLVHIALVRAGQIVPDLLDLLGPGGLGSSPMPSAAVLITGPSKTADIELILVTGVHGPGFVHVMIVP